MTDSQWTDRIGRRVRLRDLHVLLAVVQRGSMAKAAKQLATSQPVISKTIAALENAFGVPLLDRGAYGVRPTMYGQALLKRGLAVFDELREGVKEIEFLADPTAGELRVGCADMTTAGLLPAIIAELSHRYPRVHLHAVLANTFALDFPELRERSVDLLLGGISPPVGADFNADVLFIERPYVVAGIQSIWARRRKIELAELIDEPWAHASRLTSVGRFLWEIFENSGLEAPRLTVETQSIHLRCNLVKGGRYLTILPDTVLRFYAEQFGLKALPIKLPIQPQPVAIVTLKNRTLGPLAQIFMDCAREVTRQW
jgi:DNA-binding transcriptional LysR family regulator